MNAAIATVTCAGCHESVSPSESFFSAYGEVCGTCHAKVEIAEMAMRARAEQENSGSFEGGLVNGGSIVGLLTMLAAVVWFVAGMAAGVVFFYPPILFMVGLFGFIKGLVSR